MKLLFQLIVFVCIGISTKGYSQKDTLFWFAAPDISAGNGDNPILINLVSYTDPATVTLSLPANVGFVPIIVSLPANSSQSIDLSPFLAQIESPSANVVNSNGIKIVSTAVVSAYYEVNAATNKEIFSLKGNAALGNDFYTPFQKFWNNAVTVPASYSSFEIVATEDNTTVLITPRTAIVGHAQNATFSVILNTGQTYSARDLNVSAASSLAGSIVSSNEPFAITVFDGALSNGACSDAIGDQLTNSSFIGNNYIIQKGTGINDRVYILATQNSTNLTITNSVATNAFINWSETYELPITEEITHISSTKPIYVLHVSGFGCELSAAQVPNVQCSGSYTTSFTRSNTDSLGVILYTRTGFENQFLLNGNATLINPASFNTVPGTSGNYKVAKLFFNSSDIPVGFYNIIENTGDIFGMAILNGAGGVAASYAYLSEFASKPFVEAGAPDTVCANVNYPILGMVGGGPITGSWSSTGYGSFANPLTDLNNTYIPSSLDVFVNPVKIILTSTGGCASLKDTLVLFVSPPPMVNASANQTVCANNSTVQLNGSVQGGASTGIWSTLGSGNFGSGPAVLNTTYLPSSADVSSSTVNLVLTSTDNGSCIAVSDTMQIAISLPALVDAGQDTIYLCSNNSLITLNGSVTGTSTTGKWETTGNGLFSPNNYSLSNTYQPTVSDIAAGSIMLYLESTSNGNCLPVIDSVTIIFTGTPIVEAGINQLICVNDNDIQLAGTVSGATTTGIWSGGTGSYTLSNTDLNAVYTPTPAEIASGSLLLTLTSTNNGTCNSAQDLVQIVFVAPPFANFVATDVCLNLPTVFSNFSLPGYGALFSSEWNFGDGGTANSLNPSHFYAQAGTQTVELIVTNSNGCKDTLVQQLLVHDLPVADFSYVSDCPNNQVTISFTDESTSADPIIDWYYDFGGQGTSQAVNPVQQFSGQGNFIISQVVETSNGCKDTMVSIIQVNPTPIAGFSYNTDNGMNVGAVFNYVDTSSFGDSYSWNFGNNSTSTVQNPSYTYFANGNYLVTQYVYNNLGCYDSTSVWININTVTNEISTLIPNAISPNGDGYNDIWKLDFLDLLFPDATVEIFNQWGQQLYYSVGYDSPWDGKYNGEDVPDGNYYYVINLNSDVEINQFKGALLVLKQAK